MHTQQLTVKSRRRRRHDRGFASVIVSSLEGFLLVQPPKSSKKYVRGIWGFPGGKIESRRRDPYPRDAALRELYEETGLVLRPEQLTLVCRGQVQVTRNNRPIKTYPTYFYASFVRDLIGCGLSPVGPESGETTKIFSAVALQQLCKTGKIPLNHARVLHDNEVLQRICDTIEHA